MGSYPPFDLLHMARDPEQARVDARIAAECGERAVRQDDATATIVIVAVGSLSPETGCASYLMHYRSAGRPGGLAACLAAVPLVVRDYPLAVRLQVAWGVITGKVLSNLDTESVREK